MSVASRNLLEDGCLLPEGWLPISLAEIASDVSYGYTAKSTLDNVGPQLLRITDIQDNRVDWANVPFCEIDEEKKQKYLLRSGDLVFARTGATVGKSFLIKGDIPESVYASYLIRVRTLSEDSIEYLTHFFQSSDYWDQITELSSGIGQPNVNGTKLKNLRVPFAPAAEQKVIADKLDQLLAQVENTKARLDRIPDILKRFRQSVLAAAVSGKLTEEWRESIDLPNIDELQATVKHERKIAWLSEQAKSAMRKGLEFEEVSALRKYKEPVSGYNDEFKLTQIHCAPKEWLVSNLDSVAIAVTGKTPSTTDAGNWGGEIPFISPSQITTTGGITEPERYVSKVGSIKTPILPEGSILIVCIGTIGKVGLLDKESAFNQQINALISTGVIKREFLFMWAQTLHNWLNKTSSAVVNAAIINKSRLCSAPCPLPSIEEQTEIVRRVEQLFAHADKIEQQVQQAQERVNKLTQSILAKAFRGELTEQWRKAHPELISGENSAEALLAKIKAEREVVKPKKKLKRK